MYFFILYVLAYEIARGWELGFERFRTLFLGLSGLFVLQRLVGVPSTQSVFASLIVLTVLLSIVAHGITAWPLSNLYARHLEPMRDEEDMPENQTVTEMPLRQGN